MSDPSTLTSALTATETVASEAATPDVAAPPKGAKFDYAEAELDKQLGESGLLGDEEEEPELEEAAEGDEAEPDEPEGDEEDLEAPEDFDQAASAEADEDEEPEEEKEDEDLALHRAWTFLHDELNVPASVLKTTPKDKLIAWGNQARARAKEAADGTATAGKDATTGTSAAKDTNGDPAQGSTSDWSATAKTIADELGIDESTATRAFKPMFEALESKLTTLLGRVDAAEGAARAREGQATINMQVQRLSGKYPQLKADAAAKGKLVAKAAALLKSGEYQGQGAEAIFNDAAALTLGKAKRSDLGQLRRSGVGEPIERTGRAGMETGSEDDYFAKAADYALAGRADMIRKLKPPTNLRKPERSTRR